MLQFPAELFVDERQRQAVLDFVEAFAHRPLLLTDRLCNSIYINPAAEDLFAARAEEIVNRLAFSLMGYSHLVRTPPRMTEALLAQGDPWRGVVPLEQGPPIGWHFAEVSCISMDGTLVCGVVILDSKRQLLGQ